ncbi:pre-mRNA-splicing factor 38A isoform X3 [Eptesicus fuscus]|uniref:pre-mRNA-splicing factor 38A isoform X3 n=1 Tax=Eptesicus fuscus TaxID=29078 RepID=UPI0024044642|nr:pre-mRNA-splicing factor 38A isoform X3 [Eptesicus fuscus]
MPTAFTAPTRSIWWRRSFGLESMSPSTGKRSALGSRMLQIQPEKDIIVEFIKNEDFKYVRMLGALYMRLTGTAIDCYKYLEPLYNDYRKIKSQNRNGEFELMHVDEFIDELLHSERVCDIILPRLQKRYVLEEAEQLEPRVSALEEDMDDVESSEEEEEEDEKLERVPSPDHRRRSYRDLDKPRRSPTLRYRRSRSRSPRRRSRSPKRRSPSPRRERHRSKSPRRHRSRSRDRRHRSRSKSPGHHRSHRHRSHSKSPERSKKSHKKSRRGNE